MKPDSQVRFTIIGLGNLLQVIWHCFTQSLGGPDLDQRVVATTMDQPDLENKRRFFKVPVQLGRNLEALQANRPDIILFAPPPTVAPGEIETTLKPYFDRLREQNFSLPEIYAFPPMPPGRHYRRVLGPDVLVCNIIPNNVSQVAGQPIKDEGYYVVSFSGDWPSESKDRLKRIFSSQGAFVEVPPDKLVPMLGGTCTFFSLWQAVPVISEILKAHGHELDHNTVGEFMRARCQKLSGYAPEQSAPASPDRVQGPAASLLATIIGAWRDGVERYYHEIDFPQQASSDIITRGFDVILHTTQCEPRKVLDDLSIGAATKGGVLEKAIATFHTLLKPVLEKGIGFLPQEPREGWRELLADKVLETAHIVGRHGLKLAG